MYISDGKNQTIEKTFPEMLDIRILFKPFLKFLRRTIVLIFFSVLISRLRNYRHLHYLLARIILSEPIDRAFRTTSAFSRSDNIGFVTLFEFRYISLSYYYFLVFLSYFAPIFYWTYSLALSLNSRLPCQQIH